MQIVPETSDLAGRGWCSSTAREGERRGHARVQMVVFVHGYNVNQTQSSAWFAEAFKRLYQSGANSMFTGVIWNGNVSGGTRYWQDVANAFGTSQALINSVNSLQGGTNKIVIAHSLGNMLVSSAINDYGANGLKVSQYFMLDAAMPMEAFDVSQFNQGQNTNMENATYYGYTNTLWASYWYSLFPSTDGRAGLTWKNRFSNLTHYVTPVNFYSSGEDVLDNGNPSIVTSSTISIAWSSLTGGSYSPDAWYIQEFAKGTTLLQTLFATSQGGWGINPYWVNLQSTNTQVANNIPTYQLKTNPFFTPFVDSNLTGPSGSTEAAIPSVKASVLGAAIPALSFAVGRNFEGVFGAANKNNYDMTTKLEDGWPQDRINANYNNNPTSWLHSDAKNVAYPFTHKLWENIVNLGGLK